MSHPAPARAAFLRPRCAIPRHATPLRRARWFDPDGTAEVSGVPEVGVAVTELHDERAWAGSGGRRTFRRRSARFGDYVVTGVEHGPVALLTDAGLAPRPEGTVRLCIVTGGEVTLSSPDARAVLGVRDSALVLASGGVGYASQGPARTVLCDLPARVRGVSTVPASLPFVVGRSTTVVPGALAAFLVDLLRQESLGNTRTVGREVVDGLHILVSSTVTALALTSSPDRVASARREAALHVVSTHYMDPGLNTARVAERLGMSRRALQRLFENEPTSFAQHVLDVRTRQAVARLRDPRFAHASLTEIATLSGFPSPMALRRAVSDRTGEVPSRLRARTLAHAGAHRATDVTPGTLRASTSREQMSTKRCC